MDYENGKTISLQIQNIVEKIGELKGDINTIKKDGLPSCISNAKDIEHLRKDLDSMKADTKEALNQIHSKIRSTNEKQDEVIKKLYWIGGAVATSTFLASLVARII